MQSYCRDFAEQLRSLLLPGEDFRCYFRGEHSDFVRINQSRIRQTGRVLQMQASIDLSREHRQTSGSLEISGEINADREALMALLSSLRAQLAVLPLDPYFFRPPVGVDTEQLSGGELDAAGIVDEILSKAAALDLVGLYMSGPIYRGFANADGAFSWHQSQSYSFNFSCFNADGSAVKRACAGSEWDSIKLGQMISDVERQLLSMKRRPKSLKPGAYRAYLAPAALEELLGLLSHEAFHHKSLKTRRSALTRLYTGEVALNPALSMIEHHAQGYAPRFTPDGIRKPDHVNLIEQGVMRDSLVDARASAEFSIPANSDDGRPQSLQIEGGALDSTNIESALGTGLLINNLWYCNYSDINDCRMTGMTRYATFWVEDGEIQEPVTAMRFDDSLFRMLGAGLQGLTRQAELIADTDTYQRRSTNSMRLPGALIEGFRLTL